MSKSVVLKRVATVAVAGFVLIFSSCKKPIEEPKDEPKKEPKEHAIVGTWKQEKTEVKELDCGDPVVEIMLKSMLQQLFGQNADMTAEFSANGKAKFSTALGQEQILDYKVEGDKLILTDAQGLAQTYDYSITDGKKMYWDMDMDVETREMLSDIILEYYGQEVEITKCVMRMTFNKQNK